MTPRRGKDLGATGSLLPVPSRFTAEQVASGARPTVRNAKAIYFRGWCQVCHNSLVKGGAGRILLQENLSRRQFLVSLASTFLLPLLQLQSASAAVPDKLMPLIREAAGGAIPKTGRVKLTLPPLAESGNSVPLKVQVDSPMTAENYVKSIHIFSEKNPRPVIARFHLGPRSGKAEVSTRIRLAGAQQVVAVAVMNDGAAWLGIAEVVVTAAACIDEK